MTHHLTLVSFGFLHQPGGKPPTADRVVDLRGFYDPAAARDILDLDGCDPRVQRIVANTPGIERLQADLVDYVQNQHPHVVALGCAGGKHRAPSLTELLARTLQVDHHYQVKVEHRHIHLPRVLDGRRRTPRRYQRLRKADWHFPPGGIYIGRGRGNYGQYGNPYRWSDYPTNVDSDTEPIWVPDSQRRRNAAIDFDWALRNGTLPSTYPSIEQIRRDLAGRDLVCWCGEDEPCHGDPLLIVANDLDIVPAWRRTTAPTPH
jgi:UPF0042 nucleotide-binding protein